MRYDYKMNAPYIMKDSSLHFWVASFLGNWKFSRLVFLESLKHLVTVFLTLRAGADQCFDKSQFVGTFGTGWV